MCVGLADQGFDRRCDKDVLAGELRCKGTELDSEAESSNRRHRCQNVRTGLSFDERLDRELDTQHADSVGGEPRSSSAQSHDPPQLIGSHDAVATRQFESLRQT